METKSRRNFLKHGLTAVIGSAVLSGATKKAVAAACKGLTPAQTPGPFYPGEKNFHEDNDLTSIKGNSLRAKGQVIYVRGKVLSAACAPVAGATIEIWQACASGKYNNPSDPNTALLDPNFKYWGETHTAADGSYEFKTIIPGAYPADTNWMRPPHIHFKVSRLRFKELITQMYFLGNEYNSQDLILKAVPANEQSDVIVDFKPAPPDLEPNSLLGEFDITINPVA